MPDRPAANERFGKLRVYRSPTSRACTRPAFPARPAGQRRSLRSRASRYNRQPPRSMFPADFDTPRKIFPPPTTIAISTPRSCTVLDLACNRFGHGRIDPVVLRAHQGLAGKFSRMRLKTGFINSGQWTVDSGQLLLLTTDH